MEIGSIHEEIINALASQPASYAEPMSSEELGDLLNVTPSYVRRVIVPLVERRMVGVRRGRRGGYFLHRSLRNLVSTDYEWLMPTSSSH